MGLSLGSVLLLAALGLAGSPMGCCVINMAHGEMLMLGAYAVDGSADRGQRHASVAGAVSGRRAACRLLPDRRHQDDP